MIDSSPISKDSSPVLLKLELAKISECWKYANCWPGHTPNPVPSDQVSVESVALESKLCESKGFLSVLPAEKIPPGPGTQKPNKYFWMNECAFWGMDLIKLVKKAETHQAASKRNLLSKVTGSHRLYQTTLEKEPGLHSLPCSHSLSLSVCLCLYICLPLALSLTQCMHVCVYVSVSLPNRHWAKSQHILLCA